MNFKRLNTSLLLGSAAFFVASCDLVKDITYTVNPNPLEMHGDGFVLERELEHRCCMAVVSSCREMLG